MINIKRALIVACGLLAGGVTVAQQTPPDEVVGKAVFEVHNSVGGHAFLLPKTPVGFGALNLKGGADLPEGTAICSVVKRVASIDVDHQRIITVTVLKCGEYEYGISEVLFEKGKNNE